jgi:hypothetical protein
MNFWEKTKLIFSEAFNQVFDYLLPIIKLLLTEAGRFVMQVAMDAVLEAEKALTEPGSGPEKFERAEGAVKAALDNAGMNLALHLIHTAIQTAVTRMKASQ